MISFSVGPNSYFNPIFSAGKFSLSVSKNLFILPIPHHNSVKKQEILRRRSWRRRRRRRRRGTEDPDKSSASCRWSASRFQINGGQEAPTLSTCAINDRRRRLRRWTRGRAHYSPPSFICVARGNPPTSSSPSLLAAAIGNGCSNIHSGTGSPGPPMEFWSILMWQLPGPRWTDVDWW